MLALSTKLSLPVLSRLPCRWIMAIRKISGSGVHKNFKISQLGEVADSEMVANFLINNFYPYEPIGIALGINVEKEVRSWMSKYIEKTFSHSRIVSSQAIEESTGTVVGISVAQICDPKQTKPPTMMDFYDPDTQPIQHQIGLFLCEIEEGLDPAELLGIKSLTSDKDPKVLEGLMVTVNKDFWNRGLAVELIKKNIELAKKDKDCLVAKVVATSEFSYKAHLKAGYQTVREFQYAKYKNPENVKIFEGKEAALGMNFCCRVMIKDMSSPSIIVKK